MTNAKKLSALMLKAIFAASIDHVVKDDLRLLLAAKGIQKDHQAVYDLELNPLVLNQMHSQLIDAITGSRWPEAQQWLRSEDQEVTNSLQDDTIMAQLVDISLKLENIHPVYTL